MGFIMANLHTKGQKIPLKSLSQSRCKFANEVSCACANARVTAYIWKTNLNHLLMASGGKEGGGGKIKNVLSDSEFQKELITAGDRLVVVNFCVDW